MKRNLVLPLVLVTTCAFWCGVGYTFIPDPELRFAFLFVASAIAGGLIASSHERFG